MPYKQPPHAAPDFPSRPKSMALLVSAAAVGGAQGVAAQGNALEEVIVTATKRAASLQDVPQAITALTTDDIDRQGFVGLDDYAAKIPSLSFARREPGGTSVIFRGVAASGIQFGTNPSAGVYLDEQPITSAGVNPDPRLIDIQRVEALSGPQGSLFGAASQSGTLRIITNKPDTTELYGWVEGDIAAVADSDDFDREVSGMINIPLLQDRMALRLVGFTGEEAGYIDNVLGESQPDRFAEYRPAAGLPVVPRFDNSNRVADDVNSSSYSGGRAALRWDINEDWTVDIAGILQKTDSDGFGDTNLFVGEREQVRFEDENSADEWYQFSLTLEGKLDFADAVLTASYFDRDHSYDADATDYLHDFDQKYDPTGLSGYYESNLYDFSGAPRAFAHSEQQDKRWTLEGRLATPADSTSRWSGVIGFFYNKSESDVSLRSDVRGFTNTDYYANLGYYALNYLANSPYYNPNFETFHNQRSNNWFFGVYDTELEQTALFGEITFEATDDLSITAGGRWFDYEQDRTIQLGALLLGDKPDEMLDYLSTNESATAGDSDFIPKLNVTYRLDEDKLVYGTYSEGFRIGGGNAIRASSILPRSYDPDLVKNYELGFKSAWMENTLQFNAVFYHMIWEDMQIQVNDPTVFTLGIVNFSEAEIDGFEAELAWLPAPGWEINANIALLNSEIAEDNTILGEDDIVVAFVEAGTDLPITPEIKGSLAVQYTFSDTLFGAEPFIRMDYSHVGESVNSLDGTESIVFTQGPTVQDAYDIFNLRAGLEAEGWSATLYLDNATDEVAQQFYNNRWGTRQRLSINKPRSLGLNVRWHF